jgi:hypothetical protein
MRLLIFATADGKRGRTAPIVLLPEPAKALLPPNPRSLPWLYFATVAEDDVLLDDERSKILAGIARDGHFISRRWLRGAGTLSPRRLRVVK